MSFFPLKFDESTFNHTCCFSVIFAECRRCGGGGFGHPRHARPHPSTASVVPFTWGIFTSAHPKMWNVLRPRVCSDSVLPLWRMLPSVMDGFCSWLFISCLSCVAARSPIFSHLSSSLQGLWTIRAFGAQETEACLWCTYLIPHAEAWFLFLMTSRWFAFRLDSICSVFIALATFGCILFRNGEKWKHHF